MLILSKYILLKHTFNEHLIIRSKLFPKALHLPRLAQKEGGGARAGGGRGSHGSGEKEGAPVISRRSRPITGAGLDPS